MMMYIAQNKYNKIYLVQILLNLNKMKNKLYKILNKILINNKKQLNYLNGTVLK